MIYQGSIFNIWTQKIACRDGVWYRGGPNNYWLVYGYSKTLTSFIFAGPFTAKSVWALVTESMTSRVAFYNMRTNVVLLFISMAALYSWAQKTSIYSPYWICADNIGNPPSLNNQIHSSYYTISLNKSGQLLQYVLRKTKYWYSTSRPSRFHPFPVLVFAQNIIGWKYCLSSLVQGHQYTPVSRQSTLWLCNMTHQD